MSRVYVHRNLNKGQKPEHWWSIKTSAGKLLQHTQSCMLQDVEFRVRPGGNARSRQTSTRNVHAFAIGRPVSGWGMALKSSFGIPAGAVPVTYNPFRHETFVRADNGEPILAARAAYFTPRGCFALI